jgi:hypothetical protein
VDDQPPWPLKQASLRDYGAGRKGR